MSLILDALNRSRQDADPVPGLGTRHYAEPEDSNAVRWLQWLPWVALLAAVLVIGWLLVDKGGHSSAASKRVEGATSSQREPAGQSQRLKARSPNGLSVGPGANTDVAATPPPPVLPMPEEEPRAPSRPRSSQPSGLVAGPGASASPRAIDSRPGSKQELPTAARPVNTEVASLYQQAAKPPANAGAVDSSVAARQPQPAKSVSAAQPEQAVEPAIDVDEVLARAERELGQPELAAHPAPFLADLSQQAKDAIPTLMYQRHDYARGGGDAAVVINGKSLRAGGIVGGGVRIDEILPGSVIMSHRGTQFRLRALNSWVNL